jgi:hypothetical protein
MEGLMMPSNTPRSDAEIARTAKVAAASGAEQAWQDMCWFARELERENTKPYSGNLDPRLNGKVIPTAGRVQVDAVALGILHQELDALRAERDALRSDIRILIERLRFLSPKPENVGGVSVTHVFDRQLSPFTLMELTK